MLNLGRLRRPSALATGSRSRVARHGRNARQLRRTEAQIGEPKDEDSLQIVSAQPAPQEQFSVAMQLLTEMDGMTSARTPEKLAEKRAAKAAARAEQLAATGAGARGKAKGKAKAKAKGKAKGKAKANAQQSPQQRAQRFRGQPWLHGCAGPR